MNNNLLIVGAGAYGYVVKETAEAMGIFDKISFVDDNSVRDDVVGTTEMLNSLSREYKFGIVAIGNNQVRCSALLSLEREGYEIPTLIHPMAYVSVSSKVEKGCIIEPKAVVHANSEIGKGCLICAASVINHNAVIGEFCQIDCNAVIGAGASVPKETKVHYGEVVLKK